MMTTCSRLLTTLVLTVLILSGQGCKQSDDAVDPSSIQYLSEDDAANAFASALGGSQGTCGLTLQLEEAATVAGGGKLSKIAGPASVLFDTTITRQKTGTYSYNYAFHYSYGLVNANRFAFSYSMKGTYETPRMSSSDSTGASLEVSSLLTGQSYVLAALYNRYGTQASKVGNKVTFRSTITVSITNLLVDKSTRRVAGGTATVSMSGQTSSGGIFAFTGTVAFLGAQQATLLINGRTFTLDLALGTVTA